METTQRMSQESSIWKMLPLHPQPQWLESLSSYLIRLAEANGLQSMNELAALAGSGREKPSWRLAPDYPFPFLEKITPLVGCTDAMLLDTTFFHLARHFECPTTRRGVLRRFLQGSLSTSLRYCPHCLADHAIPYYRLLWRFLTITGCHKHGCRLLSDCGHCHMPIPLNLLFPKLVHCQVCQGDLRRCQTAPMPENDERWLIRTRGVEMLLMPAQWAPEITTALVAGYGFPFLRQRKHLSLNEAAHLMEKEELVIVAMEHGQWSGLATFFDYLRYMDLLGCSLSELLEATQLARRFEPKQTTRLDEIAHLVRREEDQYRYEVGLSRQKAANKQ